MKLPNIPTGDRCILFGASGEGKTTLAKALLLAKPDVIVVDTKRDPNEHWEEIGTIVRGERAYENLGGGRYIWQPPASYLDKSNDTERDLFFHWALGDPDTGTNGNRVIYLDEFLHSAPSSQSYPRWLQLCVQLGRSARLSIWGTTQDPVRVPRFLISQAEYVFSFAVGLPEYRDRIDEIMEDEIPWEELPRRSHGFVFRTPRGVFGPYGLDMDAYRREVAMLRPSKSPAV